VWISSQRLGVGRENSRVCVTVKLVSFVKKNNGTKVSLHMNQLYPYVMKYKDNSQEEKNSVKRLAIGELAVFILFYHLSLRPFISTSVTASPPPSPPRHPNLL
jgi:hypothetical protein